MAVQLSTQPFFQPPVTTSSVPTNSEEQLEPDLKEVITTMTEEDQMEKLSEKGDRVKMS